jgi:protein CrcB
VPPVTWRGLWIVARLGASFSWGTFFVNVTGSFLIGIVLVLVEAGTLPAEARLFLAVGILGGYTTFSSFSYETLQLANGGDVVPVLFTRSAASHRFAGCVLGRDLCSSSRRTLMEPSDATKLTIYVGDSFRYGHIAGATVLHGIEGYGADKQIHTARILDLSGDLRVVIIAIDRTEKIEAVIPKLDAMVDKGLVTTEEVRVVFSRPRPIA